MQFNSKFFTAFIMPIIAVSCSTKIKTNIKEDVTTVTTIYAGDQSIVVTSSQAYLKTKSIPVADLAADEKCFIEQGKILKTEAIDNSGARDVDLHIRLTKADADNYCSNVKGKPVDFFLFADSYDTAPTTPNQQKAAADTAVPRILAAGGIDLQRFSFIEKMGSGSNKWQRSYTVAALNALSAPKAQILLNSSVKITDPEINSICPNYNKLNIDERKIFWVLLFSSMTKHESDYNNNSVASNDGGGNDSIGLLQLSYEDMEWAESWGCNVSKSKAARSLKNGAANIECGVAIMARQVSKKQGSSRKVFVSNNIYWAVLNPNGGESDSVVATFKKYRNPGAGFCYTGK